MLECLLEIIFVMFVKVCFDRQTYDISMGASSPLLAKYNICMRQHSYWIFCRNAK